MTLRILMLGAATAALFAAPVDPAQAEFFTFEQMRGMCRGETEDHAEFRTDAGHRLLAETYRARCRMYLLGLADGYLQRRADSGNRDACIRARTAETEVAEALVAALIERREAPEGGIGAVVRDVLRTRFGCTAS